MTKEYFTINLIERMLPDLARIQPMTSWLPVGRASNWSHQSQLPSMQVAKILSAYILQSSVNRIIKNSFPFIIPPKRTLWIFKGKTPSTKFNLYPKMRVRVKITQIYHHYQLIWKYDLFMYLTLTLKVPSKTCSSDIRNFFFFFLVFWEKSIDISCESSAMKCQDLFSLKKKKKKMSSTSVVTGALRVKELHATIMWAVSSEKVPLSMCKVSGFTASWTVQSLIPFKHYIVSNDSISGQWRPWSGCADAQADLGILCPHLPRQAAHI